jgi:hypothetical protein
MSFQTSRGLGVVAAAREENRAVSGLDGARHDAVTSMRFLQVEASRGTRPAKEEIHMARPTIVVDLLNACAHPCVANVALASLRRETTERVRLAAAAQGLSPAVLTAARVRRFAQYADDASIGRLAAAMSGEDQPVIAGLEAIMAVSEATFS